MTTKKLADIVRNKAYYDWKRWIDDQAAQNIPLEKVLEAMPPDWYLWSVRYHGDTKRLDWCAEQDPWCALEYAAKYLTPERLDWCAEQRPWYALRCAAEYLTPERLDWCAQKEPKYALRYAAEHLTPERLDWCAEQNPRHTLESS